MKLKTYLFLLLTIPLFSFSSHKYYLSLTEINFNKETKAVQVIINVFMDDIELALNKDFGIDLQLTTKKELKNNGIYFKKYLHKKLEFTINNKIQNFNYIGKEYEGDFVFFYLEIENVENVKTLSVSNKVLTDHFPKQQNLIKVKVGKKNKSVLLSKEAYKTSIKF